MVDRPISWPFGGRSNELSFSGQEELTTVDSKNVRSLDPLTQRLRGSQRPGHSKWVANAPEAGRPIKLVGKITHPQKTGDWSSLLAPSTSIPGAGEVQTEHELKPPSQGQPYDVAIDAQGARYVLDGSVGIAKYSADLRLTSSSKLVGAKGGTWTFPLDREDGDHILRTLDVDNFGGAYAAVTQGGNPETSRIWCIETDAEVMRATGNDEPRLRWSIQMNEEDPRGNLYGFGHIGQLRWKNNLLYTVQNNPRKRESKCIVYELLNSSSPIVQRSFDIPYPAHGIAVKDNGEVLVTCPPDADRGVLSPTHRDTPKPAFPGGWNPEDDLEDYSTRIWSWLSSSLPLPDGRDPLVTTIDANTGEERVIQWLDRSGKDRHVYRDTAGGRGAPYVLKSGLGGRRGVEFRGGEALVSLANNVTLKAQADLQRTILPGYVDSAFLVVMVVELKSLAERQTVLVVHNENGDPNPNVITNSHETFDRAIVANRRDLTIANWPLISVGNVDAGWLSIQDAASTDAAAEPPAGEQGVNSAPGAAFFDTTSKSKNAGALNGVDGTPVSPHAGVLAYLCDGSLDLAGSNRSLISWNGITIDRWTSKAVLHSGKVSIGGSDDGSASWLDLEGIVYEIFVLDRIDRDDDTAGVIEAPIYTDQQTVASPGGGVGLVHITVIGTGMPTPQNGTWTIGTGPSQASGRWLVESGGLAQVTVDVSGSGHLTQPALDLTAHGLTVGGGSAPTVVTYLRELSSETDFEKLIGYFSHLYGIPHLLDPGDGTRAHRHQILGESLVTGTEEYGAFAHPYRSSSPIATGKPDVNSLWSPKGMLIKYSAEVDSPVEWILVGGGGFGYGVEVYPSETDADDEETGVQAILISGPPDGDAIDFNKITDSGDSGAVAVSGGFIGEAANEYMRMAIDERGTAYIPWMPNTIAGAFSVQVQKVTGAALLSWKSDAGDQNANQGVFAVAVPTAIPGRLSSTKFYENDILSTDVLAEKMLVALDSRDNENRVNGSGGTTGLNTINQARLVDFEENSDPPRRTVFVTGSFGSFKRQKPGDASFTSPTGGAGLLAATEDAYYSGTPHFGKFYMVDGINMFVYDPHAAVDEIKILTAKRGEIPKRTQQLYSWNSRLVALRGDDVWAMSARNDPRNWDTDPVVPTSGMAISGSNQAIGPGGIPDVLNTFVPVTTNIAIAGCDSSIFIFRGDPSVGSIELVTDQVGMAWGPCWAMLPEGLIFWIDPQGDAYIMSETGSKPQPISKSKIGAELRDIDWSTHYFRCIYSPDEDGVRVLKVPRNPGGTIVEHWFWSRRTGGWDPDAYNVTANQPTSAALFDGDDPNDRTLVFGCEDGHLRYVNPAAEDDDGQPIDSYITFGPLGERNSMRYSTFTNLRILIDPDRDGCVNYQLFVTDDATRLGNPVVEGELVPGFNVVTCRKAGAYVFLRLRCLDSGSWAFEEALMDVRPGGIRRMVPRA